MYWGEHTEGPNNTIATSVEYSTGLRRWNLAWNLRSREERRLTFSCQRLEPFWSPKFRWPICLGLKKLKLSVSWVTSIGVIVCTGSQVSDIAGVEVAVYFTVSRGDLLLKSTWIPISCVAARENCHGVVEVNAILWQRQGAKYHSHPAIQVKPSTNFGLSYRGGPRTSPRTTLLSGTSPYSPYMGVPFRSNLTTLQTKWPLLLSLLWSWWCIHNSILKFFIFEECCKHLMGYFLISLGGTPQTKDSWFRLTEMTRRSLIGSTLTNVGHGSLTRGFNFRMRSFFKPTRTFTLTTSNVWIQWNQWRSLTKSHHC